MHSFMQICVLQYCIIVHSISLKSYRMRTTHLLFSNQPFAHHIHCRWVNIQIETLIYSFTYQTIHLFNLVTFLFNPHDWCWYVYIYIQMDISLYTHLFLRKYAYIHGEKLIVHYHLNLWLIFVVCNLSNSYYWCTCRLGREWCVKERLIQRISREVEGLDFHMKTFKQNRPTTQHWVIVSNSWILRKRVIIMIIIIKMLLSLWLMWFTLSRFSSRILSNVFKMVKWSL